MRNGDLIALAFEAKEEIPDYGLILYLRPVRPDFGIQKCHIVSGDLRE